MKHSARAVAHANIALAKYWGKSDASLNLPAVPSLSLTLDGLTSETRVVFDSDLRSDEVWLNGALLSDRPRQRVIEVLDKVRKAKDLGLRARVQSTNGFATASGLASSASGFAALALAATRAVGLELDPSEQSALARSASASAARSIWGGFVALEAGAHAAEPIAGPDHWRLVMLIAVVDRCKKSVGSTEAMNRTRETSPYYGAWLDAAPALYARVRGAVVGRDLEALGEAMEQSTLLMHASMLGARPFILYPKPATLGVIELVLSLRRSGIPAYFTMDAGPQVKVLTLPEYEDQVKGSLSELPGVVTTIRATPGPDARVIESFTS